MGGPEHITVKRTDNDDPAAPLARGTFLAGASFMVALGFVLGLKRSVAKKAISAATMPTKRPELLYQSAVAGISHLEAATSKPDYKLATRALLLGSGVAVSFFGAMTALTCYMLDIRSVGGL